MKTKLIVSVLLIACLCSLSLYGQSRDQLTGTFSNLAPGRESGDFDGYGLDGYEIVAIPQSDGTEIVFQCSRGTPSSPVLVPLRQDGNTFSFSIPAAQNACHGDYHAELVAGGLVLRGENGLIQTLPRRPSYWYTHPPAGSAPHDKTADRIQLFIGPAFEEFARRTDILCPALQLRFINPGDLSGEQEQFWDHLASSVRSRLATANAADRLCANRDGLSCPTAATLDAMAKTKMLGSFAAFACSHPQPR